MEQVDSKIIDGFQLEIMQQLSESVEFAVQALINDGEQDTEAHRQAAQEALTELLTGIVEATHDAYRKSPLKFPDFEAVATIYKQIAIRAKLKALCARSPEHSDMFPTIVVETRKGIVEGALYDMVDHEGLESIHLGVEEGTTWVPVVSIQELHA